MTSLLEVNCKKHGSFIMRADNHLKLHNCKKCLDHYDYRHEKIKFVFFGIYSEDL